MATRNKKEDLGKNAAMDILFDVIDHYKNTSEHAEFKEERKADKEYLDKALLAMNWVRSK